MPLRLIDQIQNVNFVGPLIEPKIDLRMRGLCRQPYPNHPRGCPNFGKKPTCPPTSPRYVDVYKNQCLVVAAGFNIGSFVKARSQVHPDWTNRALRNSRHWQGHIRAELRQLVQEQYNLHPEMQPIMCPEAMGVDVTETCLRSGLVLEWPPLNWTYQVALLAILA